MERSGAGLLGEEERGARLRRMRAGLEHASHVSARRESSGGDERHGRETAHGIEECLEWQLGGFGPLVVLGAVPTGQRSLEHESVGVEREGRLRLGDGRRVEHDRTPGLLQRVDVLRGGESEGEGHDGDGVGEELLELRAVLVVAGGPDLGLRDSELRGERAERAGVGVEVARSRRVHLRHEDVHREGAVGQTADRSDLIDHVRCGAVAGGERTESTGSAHRGDERRGRGSAGHRRLDDRVGEVGEAECHERSPSR